MRCSTFVVLAGCLVVAGSVSVAEAQSVEGISFLAEKADVAHVDGRVGKATEREPAGRRRLTAPKSTKFAIVAICE